MTSEYRILESFTQSKSICEDKNEDGLYIGAHYIAVIDGATSKTDFSLEGKTSGQIARDILLNRLSLLKGGEDVKSVVMELQRDIVEFAKEYHVSHISASAVIYSCDTREIWSVGDCQFSVDGKIQQNVKIVDQVFAEVRSIALYSLLEVGYSEEELLEHDLAREQLLPFLRLQKKLENKSVKYGYCVFNGDCEPELFPFDMIQITSIPKDAEVVLASDGYPRLGRTLEESEEYLKEIIKEDPLCYKSNCSTKGVTKGNVSFDDRTYVRFSTINI